MSSPAAPTFRPFDLALVQLGGITADKPSNLAHAREMIMKAARGEGAPNGIKPSLVVLPVRSYSNMVERLCSL
jgi:omega-amidase